MPGRYHLIDLTSGVEEKANKVARNRTWMSTLGSMSVPPVQNIIMLFVQFLVETKHNFRPLQWCHMAAKATQVTSQLFSQTLVQVKQQQQQQQIKILHQCPFVRGIYRWLPRIKGR